MGVALDIILTAIGIYIVGVIIFVLIKMAVGETKQHGMKGLMWTLVAVGLFVFVFMSGGTLGYWE